MKIRRATENDKARWQAMRTALWPGSADDHVADIEHYFDGPGEQLATFVAETGAGEVCGFLEAGTRPYAEGCRSSPVGYIEGWWVDPAYRQQGIGAALVAAAEGWARELGLSEMASDAELANTSSHEAHRALGYAETDRLVCFRKALG